MLSASGESRGPETMYFRMINFSAQRPVLKLETKVTTMKTEIELRAELIDILNRAQDGLCHVSLPLRISITKSLTSDDEVTKVFISDAAREAIQLELHRLVPEAITNALAALRHSSGVMAASPAVPGNGTIG